MRQNWLLYVLLVLVGALLAVELTPFLKPPSTVAAQSFEWKVMVIPTTEDGRKRLEADLNNPPAGASWNSVALHMPGYAGGNAIAILKKR